MRRATPALFDALRSVTRRIVLYSADLPNSFATLSAHGVAFLNVKDDNDEVFFVDDLAHQCGHIMFNALTQEKARFLARAADTPLRDFCRDREDPRTLYSAFHGLFTFSTILWILQACVADRELSDRQRHEALGRIAFNLNKFAIDLNNLATPGLFTSDGRALYELFEGVYETVFRAHHGVARDLDVSDQPYVFDYARFAARNPAVREPGMPAAQAAWSAR
jgi:HEXXH motif-containing protein